MTSHMSPTGRLITLAALLAASAASTATISPQQALDRLETSSLSRLAPISRGRSGSLTHTLTIGSLYIFSAGDDGFMILPADDRAPALLGFADSGTLDPKANPALADWLNFYNDQLKSLDATSATAMTSSTRAERAEIEPLIATRWNQERPYNDLCPKVDGRETVTGCVATAMAQAMKYYDYPAHGRGSHSYLWRPGEEELSFDYSSTPFQWSLMTDDYDARSTEQERHAVAELMLACGISVDMHYEPGGSGAATMAMGQALIDIFDYSPSISMPNRAFYGYYEWEDMIYAELEAGRPVLYSGAGTDGGHQFICDGYRSGGYFHFNWGWGGISNGYFLLTALNPDDLGVGGGAGGFNTSQVATVGFRLPQEGDSPTYLLYNTIGFSTDQKEARAGETFRCGGHYFNYSLSTLPDGSRLGMKFVDTATGEARFAEGPEIGGYHPYDGRYDLQVALPSLPDGTYHITPVMKIDGRWEAVRMPVGYASMVEARVSDGKATFANTDGAAIRITDIAHPAALYIGHEFPLTFKARNLTSDEYYGTVTPTLIDSLGREVARSKFRPLDVVGSANEAISDYVASFTPLKGDSLTAGSYQLVFIDNRGRHVSSPLDITLSELTGPTSIHLTDFTLRAAQPIVIPSEVPFDFTITCDEGLFYDNVTLLIFPGRGGDDVYQRGSSIVYLTEGESASRTIVADLSRLADGEYLALIYSHGHPISDRIRFSIERQAITALPFIPSDSSETDTAGNPTIYDLQGHRVVNPVSGSVYIIGGRKTLFR